MRILNRKDAKNAKNTNTLMLKIITKMISSYVIFFLSLRT